MQKLLTAFFFVVSSHFAMIADGAQSPATGWWEKSEMNPRVNESTGGMLGITDVNLLPAGAPDPGDPYCTTETPCTFELFHTNGAQFNLNKKEKLNILFIPGGPGQIINEADGPGESTDGTPPKGNEVLDLLAFGDDLNGRHNLVYFHVRGTGQSMIDRPNNYDKFLRAKYVVEDIERLRKEILQDKPWDAIYAHSWGTVVAQLYAAHKFANDTGPKVKSLILSAPIVRRDSNTQIARAKQTASNLADIYRFFRPTERCVISDESYLETRVTDFVDATLPRDLEGTDNLCFITEPRIAEIIGKVTKVIQAVEEDYGSLSLVEEHVDEIKLPPELNFPRHFFTALRKLQFLGAPNTEGLLFTDDVIEMIDAALVIGFHLTPGVGQIGGFDCDPTAKFFVGAAAARGVKKDYCNRLKKAKEEFLKPNTTQSVRANYVFGAYDGVARWVFQMLKKSCFAGTDLSNFANAGTGISDKKKFVRDLAKRIGSASKDEPPVCGWDPGGANAHKVPTLILAGTNDAIIAGCQAEEFYSRGLQGQKAFLQFPGQGHEMSITNQDANSQPTKALADLIDKFITTAALPPSEFGNFIGLVKSEIKLVRARVPTLENGIIPCP